MSLLNPSPSAPASQKSRAARSALNAFIFVGSAIGLLLVTLLVMFFRRANSSNPRAFRASSDSMCPAICAGERIIVAMDAFDHRAPGRGDVILFYHGQDNVSFLKRIVAVGGDTVEPGPGNSILVNGEGVVLPGVCGGPARAAKQTSEPMQFKPVTVPADSFFVIGDNLSNSLDSRFEMFGFVSRDQVRGKVMFIYWSDLMSRIGCVVD